MDDFIYFVNSQGKRAVLASPQNNNYWVTSGRSGFSAPDVEIFSEKLASGRTQYMGKCLKPRTCSLKMICRGKTSAEKDKIFLDMLDTLLDAEGSGEGRLYYRRYDGSMVYLNCVYTGGMNVVKQYEKFQQFTLPFYAADPTYYVVANAVAIPRTQSTVTVNNNTDKNMCFYMIVGGYNANWNISGTITNTTTSKMLRFSNERPYSSIGNYYVVVDLREHQKNAYLYSLREKTRRSMYGLLKSNSDLDFAIVPGQNTVEFNLTLTSFPTQLFDPVKCEYRFNKICYGV